MANSEGISESRNVSGSKPVSTRSNSRTSSSCRQGCRAACICPDLGASSLEAQYSPSDNEYCPSDNECPSVNNETSHLDESSNRGTDYAEDESVTNYADSANQNSEPGEGEMNEYAHNDGSMDARDEMEDNIQDVLDKIDGMNEAELEKMIDQLEAFELDSEASLSLSESTQRGSNYGGSRKLIPKDKKLNWQAKASTPTYMVSSLSKLQTVDDICRARMEARERIEKLAQERIESTVSKARNEKERIKKEIREKKEAEAAARASIVSAERERVAAAKRKQQEQAEKLKKQVAERNRKEAIDKKKMIEEVENKRKALAKARMEALQAKKAVDVQPTAKGPLVQSK